jgi:hypothetical protein
MLIETVAAAAMFAAMTTSPQNGAPPNGVVHPTPAQLQTAEVAAMRSEMERARTELVQTKEAAKSDNLYTFLLTLLGSGGVFGAAAKWYTASRIDRLKLDHQQALERKTLEHSQAIELARLNADLGKAATDDRVGKLKEDVAKLHEELETEKKTCRDEISLLAQRLTREETVTAELRNQLMRQHEQIVILQHSGKQPAFAIWTMDFNGRIIDVTAACERQIMVPLGKKNRSEVELHEASEVWPPALARLLKFLDDEARVRPGHIAAAANVRVHASLPPLFVAKVLATYPDGRAYGVQGIAIPMHAFVGLPADLADLDAAGTDAGPASGRD